MLKIMGRLSGYQRMANGVAVFLPWLSHSSLDRLRNDTSNEIIM